MTHSASYRLLVDRCYRRQTEESCSRSYLLEKDLQVLELHDAVILPGAGVLDEKGAVFPHSALHRGKERAYLFEKSAITDSSEDIVYVGTWVAIWGHCLTDNIKHLWFIFRSQYHWLFKLKWVYSVSGGGEITDIQQFVMLLRKWGIDITNLYKLEKVTRFKRVFLPDDAFLSEGGGKWDIKYYTPSFLSFYDIKELPTPSVVYSISDKVYFSRTKMKSNKDFGEDYLENAFRKMGYKILYPEEMTLDEQIFVLRNCNCFAATQGSIAHNAVFLNEGAELILIRKAHYINGYQYAINDLKKLRVTIIDSHKSWCTNYVYPWAGPFFLYCSYHLRTFFNVDLGHFPFLSFVSYIFLNAPKFIRIFLRAKYHVIRKWIATHFLQVV